MPSETNKLPVTALGILAVASGACALAYEVLYMRILTTLMGDVYYTQAAILCAFIFGIGLGAKVAYKYLDKLYLLEIGTGLYAFLLPTLLSKISESNSFSTVTESPFITIIFSASLVLLPGILIGFSIPLFSQYIKEEEKDEHSFSLVFRLYHLGTVLSILIVEFFLIHNLGFRSSIYFAGSINIIIGIILWSKFKTNTQTVTRKKNSYTMNSKAALIIASFSSAVFQMFFFQLCYQLFKPSRENFSIALCISMLGLFLGAILVKRFKLSLLTLMTTMSIAVSLTFIFYNNLSQSYISTVHSSDAGALSFIIIKFVYGLIIALIPMICFGGLIPSLMHTESKVAEESGELIWLSSIANVFGYLCFVILLSELMTIPVLITFIIALGLTAALISINFKASKIHYAISVLSLVFLSLVGFRWNDINFYAVKWLLLPTWEKTPTLKTYKSGPNNMTLVSMEDKESITYNGHASITVKTKGRPNQAEIFSGIIPALSAPNFERALVLGFGTGITAGTVANIFEHTDVVDINNAAYKMMPDMADVNLDIENNESASLYLNDGRAFLRGKEKVYDAILSTVAEPDYFAASKIYTQEFHRDAAQALKDNGVLSMWVSDPNMTEAGLESIFTSLYSQFQYCELRVMGENYFMITCSRSPITPRNVDDLPITNELKELMKHSVPSGLKWSELLADLRLSENIFKHYKPNTKLNTDDYPVLEFIMSRQIRIGSTSFFHANMDMLNIKLRKNSDSFTEERKKRRDLAFKYFGMIFYKSHFSQN